MNITNYRPPTRTTISSNLAHQRTRHNPTNEHTPLWGEQSPLPMHKMRYNATFHSNVFNPPAAKQEQEEQEEGKRKNTTVVYENNSKIDRQIALNPSLQSRGGINPGINAWFDRDKEALLKKTRQQGRRHCLQRKLRDLSSNPITHPSHDY